MKQLLNISLVLLVFITSCSGYKKLVEGEYYSEKQLMKKQNELIAQMVKGTYTPSVDIEFQIEKVEANRYAFSLNPDINFDVESKAELFDLFTAPLYQDKQLKVAIIPKFLFNSVKIDNSDQLNHDPVVFMVPAPFVVKTIIDSLEFKSYSDSKKRGVRRVVYLEVINEKFLEK